MKKTMFDILESTPAGIDEETITPAYEISPEKVKEGVHKKLSDASGKGGKTKMKKSRRKVSIILAAAVISALALGTLTAGALGGINSFIGEHSAGEMVNNLYPGADVKLTTNNNMNGEFIGITGDDTNMMSLVQIRNADGSDIIEKGKDAFIESNDYYNYYNKTCSLVEEEVADIDPTKHIDVNNIPMRKAKIWHDVGYDISDTTGPEFDNDPDAKISHSIWFRDPFDTPYAAFVDYEMADSKTINCYLYSNIDSGLFQSLKGETLKAADKNLYIYQIDKVLYQSDSTEDFAYFIADYDKFNNLITENIYQLNDDQVITLHGTSIVVATRKEIDIDMDISVKLNYKSNIRQLKPSADVFKGDNGVDFTISKIAAGSLSTELELDFTVADGKDEYETFTGLFPDDNKSTKITLTNGNVIYAECSLNRNYWEHHSVTLKYCDSTDEFTSDWLIVNPEEIKSIEFNGKKATAE